MNLVHESKTKTTAEPGADRKKRNRRSPEQLIADMEAKIQSLRARAAKKRIRGNPAVRHTVAAVRSIDKAMASTGDATQRGALADARDALTAWLTLEGIAVPHPRKTRTRKQVAEVAASAEALSEGRARRSRRVEIPSA